MWKLKPKVAKLLFDFWGVVHNGITQGCLVYSVEFVYTCQD